MFIEDLKDKNILILGITTTSIAISNFLKKENINISMWDISEKIKNKFKEFYNIIDNIDNISFEDYDFFIVPKDVLLTNEDFNTFLNRLTTVEEKVFIDIEFLYNLFPNNKYIGIIGGGYNYITNSLLNDILNTSNINSFNCASFEERIDINNIPKNINIEKDSVFSISLRQPKMNYLKQMNFDIVAILNTNDHKIEDIKKKIILRQSKESIVILNIDNDHLDYFKTFENIKNAFIKYVKIIPNDGLLVVNGDDHNCLDLLQYTNATKLTYGITNKNTDFFAVNIVFDNNGFPAFDVYKKDKFFERIQLKIPGMHNVLNALACIALCDYYGIESNYIKAALQKFTGAHRRFEYKGIINGATVFDDYGHHPTEIVATAKALMNKKYNKSWVVFQPHTYSRTKTLLNDFAKALLNFDNIIITDIYAARETNRYGVSSQDLVDKIISLGKKAIYIQNFDDIINYLKEDVKENDIILTLGAGTVTNLSDKLVEEN